MLHSIDKTNDIKFINYIFAATTNKVSKYFQWKYQID